VTYHDKFKTVEEYLAHVPKEQRVALEKLRKLIKSIAPEAKEKISYGMPTFTYHGNLVHYAAFKNHLSFFPGGRVEEFAKELKGYQTSKGTIHFQPDKPLPDSLVKKIVKTCMLHNEAKKGYRK